MKSKKEARQISALVRRQKDVANLRKKLPEDVVARALKEVI